MVTSWKIIVATLVIYTAGLVTGTYLSDLKDGPRRSPDNRRDPSSPRGPRMQDFVQRFGDELNLSNQQRTNITQIVKTSQERMNELMKEMQPRIHREFTSVNDEIKEQLTGDQKAEFEKIMSKRGGRGGFGPGRGGGWRNGKDPNHERGPRGPGHRPEQNMNPGMPPKGGAGPRLQHDPPQRHPEPPPAEGAVPPPENSNPGGSI